MFNAVAKKFYVVWKGRAIGVFDDWNTCKTQVEGFTGAQYKSFESYDEATRAFHLPYEKAIHKKPFVDRMPPEVAKGYSVDAACSGNPGVLEYRGVKNDTGDEIFHQGPFEDGTNNIGEFLAIVHALAYLKRKRINAPLYSDSRTALAWAREKKCKSELARTQRNTKLFELIERAEKWLNDNDYQTSLRKWTTKSWGENPADFGRK